MHGKKEVVKLRGFGSPFKGQWAVVSNRVVIWVLSWHYMGWYP